MNNNNIDKQLCIICIDSDGKIILCSRCKYKYCLQCAKKINNLCSICYRTQYKNNDDNLYNLYDDFTLNIDLENNLTRHHYYTVITSLTIGALTSFIWIISLTIFGYIGILYFVNLIIKIVNYF